MKEINKRYLADIVGRYTSGRMKRRDFLRSAAALGFAGGAASLNGQSVST